MITDLTPQQKCLVWHEAIEIVRTGSKPVVVDGVTHDTWAVQIPLRASLCDAEGALYDPEVIVPSPVPHMKIDVADILHDERVQQAFYLLQWVAEDLLTGDLAPLVEAEPEEA